MILVFKLEPITLGKTFWVWVCFYFKTELVKGKITATQDLILAEQADLAYTVLGRPDCDVKVSSLVC